MSKLFIFAAAFTVSVPALAAEPVPTARINIADLDLASEGGQHMLARRIGAAVEQVCGSYANVPDLADQMRIADCRSTALGDAHQQLAARRTTVELAARK